MKVLTTVGSSVLLVLLVCVPLRAQTILEGSVEDAVTRQPVREVRIVEPMSGTVVFSDSAGDFRMELADDAPTHRNAEGLGYMPLRYELPPGSTSARQLLQLQPAPMVLEGVTAITATAMTTLDTNLRNRRNSYGFGPVRGLDRDWLNRFAPIGSAFDVVRRIMPQAKPCPGDSGQLCTRGRVRTRANPYPVVRVSVCIDEIASWASRDDLEILPIESVALIEKIGRSSFLVYTTDWMAWRARNGRTSVPPLIMACSR